MIAATALSAGASVATRDIAGFAGCGLTLIDYQSQDGGLKDQMRTLMSQRSPFCHTWICEQDRSEVLLA